MILIRRYGHKDPAETIYVLPDKSYLLYTRLNHGDSPGWIQKQLNQINKVTRWDLLEYLDSRKRNETL